MLAHWARCLANQSESLLRSDGDRPAEDAECKVLLSVRSLSYPPNCGANARNPRRCRRWPRRQLDSGHRKQPPKTNRRLGRFRLPQNSVCSEISRASSNSMRRYLTCRLPPWVEWRQTKDVASSRPSEPGGPCGRQRAPTSAQGRVKAMRAANRNHGATANAARAGACMLNSVARAVNQAHEPPSVRRARRVHACTLAQRHLSSDCCKLGRSSSIWSRTDELPMGPAQPF